MWDIVSTDIIRYTSQPLSLGSSATWKIDFGAHNSTLRNRCQRHLKMDDQELKMTEMTSYPPQSSLWVLNQHDLWYLNNSQHDCDSRAHTGYKIIHVKTDQTMEHWKSKNMGHLMTFTSFYISNHLEFLLVIWFSLLKTDQWNSRENDPGTLKTPYFKSTRRQHRGHRHQVPPATPSVSMSFICCIKLIKFVLLHHRVVWHPT